jgi:hypothetical protein
LVAQFGGAGNLERTHRRADAVAGEARFQPYLRAAEYGPHFEEPEPTRRRMEAAGFQVTQARLHIEIARFERGERFEAFLRTVVLRQPVAKLPEALQGEYLRAVAGRTLEEERSYLLDYVRLTVRATS